ncbi:hypothetical protein V2J09_019872 [Rumex salicifolius]
MSSSFSSFSISNVRLPISSSSKRNGGSNSCLPTSVKTVAKPKQSGGIVMASIGGNAGETTSRDSLDHLQRVSSQQNQPRKRITQPQQPLGATPVVVWDRIPAARTVQQMMDAMDRLMEDPFAYNWAEGNGYPRRRAPWNIKESQTSYKIRYDMPGMNRTDVKVWVEDKMLVLKAEKKKSQVDDEDDWPPETYGKYSNRIALPETVDLEKIKAEVKDGVLYITIPKARETSKKIDISVY